MNKIFRKALAVILSAVMVFTALPFAGVDFSDFSAWAAEYITGEVFTLGSYPQKTSATKKYIHSIKIYAINMPKIMKLNPPSLVMTGIAVIT